MSKTVFNWICADWKRIKNHCRTTDNKGFTDKDASETFRKKLLISEHTPIRLLQFDWSWHGIKSWVATHWVRHKFEKFVSTQRDDRTDDEVSRDDKPQSAPVNFDGCANMQELIDSFRKRLCFCASPETRGLAEDFKETLHESHPLEADILVPNCIYRFGCPEFKTCGYLKGFERWCLKQGYDLDELHSIQLRYDLYNRYFYELRGKKDGDNEES